MENNFIKIFLTAETVQSAEREIQNLNNSLDLDLKYTKITRVIPSSEEKVINDEISKSSKKAHDAGLLQCAITKTVGYNVKKYSIKEINQDFQEKILYYVSEDIENADFNMYPAMETEKEAIELALRRTKETGVNFYVHKKTSVVKGSSATKEISLDSIAFSTTEIKSNDSLVEVKPLHEFVVFGWVNYK